MASINFTNELGDPSSVATTGYTYKDMHFDITQAKRGISNTNVIGSIRGKDIQADIDEVAIYNSIMNILSTRRGQRFLLPTFGCSLLQFIGKPCTTVVAHEIGQTILNSIQMWEPRVQVSNVLVTAKPASNEYDIQLTITIPNFKIRDIKIMASLSNQGILRAG